jgi:hypothetical protein
MGKKPAVSITNEGREYGGRSSSHSCNRHACIEVMLALSGGAAVNVFFKLYKGQTAPDAANGNGQCR